MKFGPKESLPTFHKEFIAMSFIPPEVPIQVDKNTGVWQTDGLPMLYVPRHFFNNLHLEIEHKLGRDDYIQSLFSSGFKSAYFWCEQESKTHGLQGIKCFEHYLNRLSQRGWGQFTFANLDEAETSILKNGSVQIRIDNSSFVLHLKTFKLPCHTDGACYQFSGWFAGATEWMLDQLNNEDTGAKAIQDKINNRLQCHETQCSGNNHAYCLFQVN